MLIRSRRVAAVALVVLMIAAFALVAALGRDAEHDLTLNDIAGLSETRPWMAAAMAVAMLSLLGFPGTVGFIGKWYILSGLAVAGQVGLAVVLELTSVVSAGYYLPVIMSLYMRPAPADRSELAPLGMAAAATVAVAVALVMEEIQGHPDFPTQEAFRVLDDIAGYAQPVIVLSGGEPLMRKDVFDIARYGTGRGLRMCLATNGTLVNDDICLRIKESGIRIVSLSLDGSTEHVHDDFRSQQGAFAGTINAARLFKQHGIEFIVNSSFTKRNQEEIPKVYHLAKDLGATAWYMFMIVPTGRGEEIMHELISKEDYEDILE